MKENQLLTSLLQSRSHNPLNIIWFKTIKSQKIEISRGKFNEDIKNLHKFKVECGK